MIRALLALLLAVLPAVVYADSVNTNPASSGAGCANAGCTPTASWFTTQTALTGNTMTTTGLWTASGGLAALSCNDDLNLTPLQIYAIAGVSGSNVTYNVGTFNPATSAIISPISLNSTSGDTSPHDWPSCMSLGNGFFGIYTHGESGNELCISSSGGSGNSQHCSDIWIGNTLSALCSGSANIDICNASSEHPLPIGGGSGGPLSEVYSACINNLFGKTNCMLGGQEQHNTSFSGGMTGNFAYMSLTSAAGSPPTLLADVGVPGGAETTYDIINGTITATAGQGLQQPAFSSHDDNVIAVDVSADSCTTTCAAGAAVVTLPATGSFAGCTASSPSFTHGTAGTLSATTLDVQNVIASFNAGSWTGTGCSGYASVYNAVNIQSANRQGRGCATADDSINSPPGTPSSYTCFDVLLTSGNPVSLSAPSASCASPFTCTNVVGIGAAANNHSSTEFCRMVPVQRSFVVICLMNYTASSYLINSFQGAQSGGPAYVIYRSPGRGVSVPNATGTACNVTANSSKWCWCDWWYSNCTASGGVDPTTWGTNGSPTVLGGGTGGGCTVGSWPTCAGGIPKVCTTDTSCTYQSTFYVPNPTAGNDTTLRNKFYYDFSEGQIAHNGLCSTNADPATTGSDVTYDPVSGAGYFVFEACDTTGTNWNLYLAKLDPVCCTTDFVAKVAVIGSSGANLINSLLTITNTNEGHVHIWVANADGGSMCSNVGVCIREWSPTAYPITASTTYSTNTVYNPAAQSGNSAVLPCERNKREEPDGQYVSIGCGSLIAPANGSQTILAGSLVDNT